MDALQMHRLEADSLRVENPHQYDEVTIVTVPEMHQGLITNAVEFDCTTLKNEAPIWADSWVEIPFAIYSSGVAPTTTQLTAAGVPSGVPAAASTPYTSAVKVAVKSSLLSLIGGIAVQATEGGTQILNEQSSSTPIKNALSLLLESTVDWIDSAGPAIHYFGKDTNLPYTGVSISAGPLNSHLQSSSLMATYGAMSVVPDVSVGAVGIDPTVNTALLSRVTILGSMTNATATIVNVNGQLGVPALCFLACIPLRLIHNLFSQLDFPLPNCPLKISFYPAGMGSLTGYAPVTLPVATPNFALATTSTYNTGTAAIAPTGVVTGTGTTFTSGMVGGVLTIAGESFLVSVFTSVTQLTVTPSPANAIAAAVYTITFAPAVLDTNPGAVQNLPAIGVVQTFTDKWAYGATCALKVRCVRFDASDNKRVAAMYEKGSKKRIEFITTDLPGTSMYRNAALSGNMASVNWPIGTYVRPYRVTLMVMPTGTLASQLNVFPGTIGGFQGPNSAGTFYLRGCNVQLDGTPFYRANIDGQRELYRLLEQEANGMGASSADGCQIGFADFLNGTNPYMFNVSRSPKVNHNNAVRLTFVGIVGVVGTAPGNYDLYALVETIKTLTFHLSDSKISLSVADGVH